MGQVYDMIVIGDGTARIFWCSGRPLCEYLAENR